MEENEYEPLESSEVPVGEASTETQDEDSLIAHEDVDQHPFLLDEDIIMEEGESPHFPLDDDKDVIMEETPPYPNGEDQEVLETSPGLRAEIDDNPEPELFEPTPENYSEYQPSYSGDYESEDENHSGQ
jgi:hypothetical protein